MSQLVISSNYSEDISLNVISFSSPISQSIPSAQTKSMIHHYPYKVSQPQVRFQVIFRSEEDYEAFQNFVRKHHLAMISEGSSTPEITMWWPERGINNWTGFIREFQAGGQKSNPAPKAEFVVELVDSFISRKTTQSSFGSPFSRIFGNQIASLKSPSWFKLPSIPSSQSPPPSGASTPSSTIPPLTPLPQPGGGNGGGGSF